MKIVVLAISLNEEQFVQRWAESAKEADEIILVDTGSTDGTIASAPDYVTVKTISVKPWRFDVARNSALSQVPADADIVINLDLDEMLMPGWRESVEKIFADPDITRLYYDYIWSHNPDGSPGVRFYRDMIHRRNDYLWKHPCHETLYYVGNGKENIFQTDDVKVEHHPDSDKSRSQYLPLLIKAVEEDPENDRMSHYLARELFFNGLYEPAIEEFKRHLSLKKATWETEKSESLIFISKCYEGLQDLTTSWEYAKQACIKETYRREPYTRAANVAYNMQSWLDCAYYVDKALSITIQNKSYMNDPVSYGPHLYDIGCIAAINLGHYQKGLDLLKKALEFTPDDARLLNNLEILEKLCNPLNLTSTS